MRRTLHDGGDVSPLAEGRELKFMETLENHIGIGSPLAEGRELKFVAIADALLIDLVAPRRGAGIEMWQRNRASEASPSPLAEGRELK